MQLLTSLIQPDSLDSVADLRDALARTNATLDAALREIAHAQGALFSAMSQLATLAAHRHHGNTDAILRQLDVLFEKYPDKGPASASIH